MKRIFKMLEGFFALIGIAVTGCVILSHFVPTFEKGDDYDDDDFDNFYDDDEFFKENSSRLDNSEVEDTYAAYKKAKREYDEENIDPRDWDDGK